MRLRDALADARRALARAGIDAPAHDARALAAHALGRDLTWTFAHVDVELTPGEISSLESLVAERAARRPLQHLTGRQPFRSLELDVSPAVLVPRPETEDLVARALCAVAAVESPRLLDVGTGSGCIAACLAVEQPRASVLAVDVSGEALEVARRNVRRAGVTDRVSFARCDLLTALSDAAAFHAVVANLPYVSEGEWEHLEPEVRDHDPRGALVGGPRGTELMLRLVSDVARVLAPGGWIGLEVGHRQAEEVRRALVSEGHVDVRVTRDLSGIERVVEGRRPT